jgi:hypothetical protein
MTHVRIEFAPCIILRDVEVRQVSGASDLRIVRGLDPVCSGDSTRRHQARPVSRLIRMSANREGVNKAGNPLTRRHHATSIRSVFPMAESPYEEVFWGGAQRQKSSKALTKEILQT